MECNLKKKDHGRIVEQDMELFFLTKKFSDVE